MAPKRHGSSPNGEGAGRRRARLRAIAALVLAGAALAGGCEEAPPSTLVVFSREEPWSFAQPLMTKGGLPVVVVGDVDGTLQQTVVAAMRQGMSWTATPNLVAVRDVPAAAAAHVIVVFDGGGGESGCRQPPPAVSGVAAAPSSLTMLLCAGGERIAEVRGRFGKPTPPDAPAFTRLVRRATGELFGR